MYATVNPVFWARDTGAAAVLPTNQALLAANTLIIYCN